MDLHHLRRQIGDYLGFHPSDAPVIAETVSAAAESGYRKTLIQFAGDEGKPIPAYLLLPEGDGPFPAVLVHHQHNGERHLGKSEVCGLAGDPLQAFGPVLARRGIAVLAPDSICFEDRRKNKTGIEPDAEDVNQHFTEMCHRLVRGDTLMRKVLDDSARGISLLRAHPRIDPNRVGILGHSYGGNTVLFHAALDSRIRFACSSGAACSYRYKLAHGFGIEMAEVIPGFAARFDIADLVACMAPRRALLVSADLDPHSADADEIAAAARGAYAALGAAENLKHVRYAGGHAVTRERFDFILRWLAQGADQVDFTS